MTRCRPDASSSDLELAVGVARFDTDRFGAIGFVDGLQQCAGRSADIQRASEPTDAVALQQFQLIFRPKALLAQVLCGGFFGCLVKLAVGLLVKNRVRGGTFTGVLIDKPASFAEVISDLEAERVHFGDNTSF